MPIRTRKLFDTPLNWKFNINYTCVFGISLVKGPFLVPFFGLSFHPFDLLCRCIWHKFFWKARLNCHHIFFFRQTWPQLVNVEKMHLVWLDFGIRLMRFLWQMIWKCICQMENENWQKKKKQNDMCGWLTIIPLYDCFYISFLGEIRYWKYWKWPFKGRMNNLYEIGCVGSGKTLKWINVSASGRAAPYSMHGKFPPPLTKPNITQLILTLFYNLQSRLLN